MAGVRDFASAFGKDHRSAFVGQAGGRIERWADVQDGGEFESRLFKEFADASFFDGLSRVLEAGGKGDS